MTRNEIRLLSRRRMKRNPAAMTAPEWRENARDFALMVSGVYQDLRGDTVESLRDFNRWLRAGLRRLFTNRVD